VSEEEEVLQCESLEEAVNYLRVKEVNSNLTLKQYRKRVLPTSVKQLVDLLPLVYAMATVIGMACRLEKKKNS